MSNNEIVAFLAIFVHYLLFLIILPAIYVYYKAKNQIKNSKYKKRRKSFKLIKNENPE